MKICFVLENFYPKIGGAEFLFFNIANRLVQNGNAVRVITAKLPNTKKYEKLNGIEIYRYTWPSLLEHSYPLKKNLVKHIEWSDVVHTTTYTAAIPTLSVSKKCHKKCIITVHEVLGNKWFLVENPILALFFKHFEKAVVKKSYDAWHVVSEATKKDLMLTGIDANKIICAYPGIDNEPFTQNPGIIQSVFGTNKKCILFYGRYGKTKGINVLLQAISLAQNNFPQDIFFGIITDKPNEAKRDRDKLNISSNLVNISDKLPRKDLLGCVKNALFVVVPSLTEGFGFTTAETCNLETPIVASNAGSLPEVVSGRYLIFNNGDPVDLQEKIKQALKNQFKKTPKKTFLWSKTVKDIESAYKSVLTKKIGIVCDPMDLNFKGITNYVNNLIEHICQQNLDFELYLIHLDKNPIIEQLAQKNPAIIDIIIPTKKFPFSYEYRKIISLPQKVRELNLDIIHETANAGGNMFFHNNTKQITTIHDITPITHPEWHTLQNWFRNKLLIKYTLKNSVEIITVSNDVKNQLVKRYNVDPNKIKTIYLAGNKILKNTTPERLNLPIKPRKYILSVSTIEPRKNFERLSKAFSILDTDFKLVIAGKWGWKSEKIKQNYLSGKYENVVYTGEINNNQLAWLYKNAYAFCMPSLDEGFGMPIIEASEFDLPILCSNIPVFKEVTSDKDFYFNPMDVMDIKEKMEQFLKEKIKSTPKKIDSKFNWENTAAKTLESYRKII